MDQDLARMLDAHVRFEVGRWTPDSVRATVREEASAVFGWLGTVPLQGLVPLVTAQAWTRRIVMEAPLTEDLLAGVEGAVLAASASLAGETEPLAALLPEDGYSLLVSGVLELRELREEVLRQVTASSVYAELISHVLYHGVKNYLLTENAVMRNLPGASALLRMGQSAVRSATPNLEAGIDRRLLAFVASSVAETIRDSRGFLETILNDGMLTTVTDEIWAVNSGRSIAELTSLAGGDALGDLVAAGQDVWLAVRSSPVVGRLTDAVVEQVYIEHGDEPVATLLAAAGLTQERVSDALVEAAGCAVAADGGALETYVRGRLEAFYSSYAASGGQRADPGKTM